MPKVAKCMCEECHYNKQFECTAEHIEVNSTGDLHVQSSAGTACNTFISRKK